MGGRRDSARPARKLVHGVSLDIDRVKRLIRAGRQPGNKPTRLGIVAAGNRLGLTAIGDLARPGLRYVNRQRGAGTRVLLDYELSRAGIDPASISGYAREEPTHLAVAAAISSGRADCGMGVQAAARAFELGFVPITREPYDLVLERQTADAPFLAPLWELMASVSFRADVEALGGYDTAEMGRRIL